MTPKYLLLFFFLISWHLQSGAVSTKDTPLAFFQGSLDEAFAEARRVERPLMVYVTYVSGQSKETKRMHEQTWSDPSLVAWAGSHYVPYLCVVSQDSLSTIRLPHYKVSTSPTLLIYRPDGRLMGTVEGFVAPSTLTAILRRHYEKIYPTASSTYYAFRRAAERPLQVQPLTKQEVTLSIAGLEDYSLQQLHKVADAHPALGLRVGDYKSRRKIEREIRRMEKVWPGEMWVYAQKQSLSEPVYTLVLGTFEDMDTANRYAHAMDRYHTHESAILDLTALLEEP